MPGTTSGRYWRCFQTSQGTGKYHELRQHSEREALRWLRRTYDQQVAWAEAHESTGRKAARAALQWAMSQPWPGRTGNSDRAVYLAHCAIAYRVGRATYQAGVRELAERAGVALETAHKANRRLVDAGHVVFEHGSFATAAAVYALRRDNASTLPHVSPRGGVYQVCPLDTLSHDAFRSVRRVRVKNVDRARTLKEIADGDKAGTLEVDVNPRLGKSAAHVWAVLRDNPGLSVAELAELTGRNVKTVARAIGRMARIVDADSGEVMRLVESDGDGWRAVEVDLDAIARAIGTAGAADRQRKTHAQQRAGFARVIAQQRAGDTPTEEADG